MMWNLNNFGGDKTLSQPGNVTPEKIMQLGLGFWASKVLLSAIELGVFTALNDRPLSAEDLTAKQTSSRAVAPP